MNKLQLKNITLFGLDTLNFNRLQKAANICKSYADFDNEVLLSNKDVTINSISDYSKFIVSDLYKYITTDYVLIIQYDGFILNPAAWSDEFYNYDYIGATWKFESSWMKNITNRVGNGGFSFRSKKLLNRLSKIKYNGTEHAEDVFISIELYEQLISEGFKFAPIEIANKFSHEFGIWNGSFGFHSFERTNISNWKDKNKYEYNI